MTTSSQLQVTTTLDGDVYTITANVVSGGYLPADIFLYKNTGQNTLGDYWGVANTDELTRFQVFSGTAIPKFGNDFVRSNQAKIIVNVQEDSTPIIQHITKSVQNLSTALQLAASSTQIINIT